MSSDQYILIIAVLLFAIFISRRIYDWPTKAVRSDAMRKTWLYAELFRLPIALTLIAAVCWYAIPYNITSFRGSLIATILGVGIAYATTESAKRVTEHKRLKRTLETLRYVISPYLKRHSEDIAETFQNYSGTLLLPQAILFLTLVVNLDTIALSFDKTWLQLVHSQDFIDAIDDDKTFYKIADVEFEVLSFPKALAGQSVRAKYLLAHASQIPADQQAKFISEVQGIRDALQESADNLGKYSEELEKASTAFLLKNGAKIAKPE